MAKKRKQAKPMRVAPGMADWLKRAAEEASRRENRIVTVVEASGRLSLALELAKLETLSQVEMLGMREGSL